MIQESYKNRTPLQTHHFFTLQEAYNDLLVTDTTMKDIKSSQYLHTLQDHINHVKENQIWARTGRPWLMLMQIVAIIRMFILEWTTSLNSRGQDYKEKHKTLFKTNVKRTVLNNTKLRHF